MLFCPCYTRCPSRFNPWSPPFLCMSDSYWPDHWWKMPLASTVMQMTLTFISVLHPPQFFFPLYSQNVFIHSVILLPRFQWWSGWEGLEGQPRQHYSWTQIPAPLGESLDIPKSIVFMIWNYGLIPTSLILTKLKKKKFSLQMIFVSSTKHFHLYPVVGHSWKSPFISCTTSPDFN